MYSTNVFSISLQIREIILCKDNYLAQCMSAIPLTKHCVSTIDQYNYQKIHLHFQERCETLQKDIVRLENELLRAKRFSFVTERQHDLSMSFTDAGPAGAAGPITSSEDVKKLQQENQELRDKLVSTFVDR